MPDGRMSGPSYPIDTLAFAVQTPGGGAVGTVIFRTKSKVPRTLVSVAFAQETSTAFVSKVRLRMGTTDLLVADAANTTTMTYAALAGASKKLNADDELTIQIAEAAGSPGIAGTLSVSMEFQPDWGGLFEAR